MFVFFVWFEFFDGEFVWLVMVIMSFVDMVIGVIGNEINDFVFVCYLYFVLILDGFFLVIWVYCEVLVLCFVIGLMKIDRMMFFVVVVVVGS